MKPCSVCGNESGNEIHQAKEKMLGMYEDFRYQECAQCGLVELIDVPKDLGKYYPSNYYSFNRPSKFKQYLKGKRGSFTFGKKSVLGALTYKLLGPSPLSHYFKEAQVKNDDAIIDIGCGYGSFISELRDTPYRNVMGVDPNISENIQHGNIEVKKAFLHDLKGKSFDFIMLHHSLEHMDKPKDTIREIERILSKDGKILIRIPVIGYAWKHYGVNWYSLDAPRHLYLHSKKSLAMLLDEFGLEIYKIVYDSSDQQFWGSEQYLKNITLDAENSYYKNPKNSMFSPETISSYKKAEELNQQEDGDMACFYVSRKGNAEGAALN